MEVAPFFVDFHHFLSIFTIFLSIFTIFYRFSRFTHFCRDLHFVALFPQIIFGQNSLLRHITGFLHVWKILVEFALFILSCFLKVSILSFAWQKNSTSGNNDLVSPLKWDYGLYWSKCIVMWGKVLWLSSIICGLLLGSICVKTGLLPSKKETLTVVKEILWKINFFQSGMKETKRSILKGLNIICDMQRKSCYRTELYSYSYI